MRAGPEPASANSLTHASTRPPPGTDLSPLQTVFSCSIQPLDPRNAKVGCGATPAGSAVRHQRLKCAESGHAKTAAPENFLRRISVGGLP